ncbi:unnamed protein product [Periconia digitata]|uniref:Uncharacterized protein n=1 Tax=Periconia digitata TaxID=1303443 RepID=A0A9W4US24_9PLEO|nr:unnamed protein product [Periconia digitata]
MSSKISTFTMCFSRSFPVLPRENESLILTQNAAQSCPHCRHLMRSYLNADTTSISSPPTSNPIHPLSYTSSIRNSVTTYLLMQH